MHAKSVFVFPVKSFINQPRESINPQQQWENCVFGRLLLLSHAEHHTGKSKSWRRGEADVTFLLDMPANPRARVMTASAGPTETFSDWKALKEPNGVWSRNIGRFRRSS